MFSTLFRTRLRRLSTVPAILAAAGSLVAFTYPGGIACAYDDLREYETHQKMMADSKNDAAQYDATIANLCDRIAAKDQLILEMIAGRLTLREVTARVLEINRSNEVTCGVIDSTYPGDTFEEKTARNVIDFMKTRMQTSPAPSNTVPRIQAQFQEMFGKTISIS